MSEEQGEEGKEQSLLSHLVELRNRLLRAVIGVLVVLVPMVIFSGELFSWLSGPLLAYMPEGTSLIATQVASPFLVPLKLAVLASVVVALPWILYQIWAFVAPGLYMTERRLVLPLLASSTLLFYTGMAFAYYVVFPAVFHFFVTVAPQGVAVMTDIKHYLDFVLSLFLAFGIAFEIPVAMVLLV
ncbi:MAG: twin-arginine translocase subunit TatC, partial [Sinobacteraceae bacterium]|nr:twin-arginine translocase subunit TatC [Nevskiaceae bacterium]